VNKPAIITIGIIVALVVLIQPGVSNAIFALIFLGMIPGTNVSIPSWAMLLMSAIGIILAIRWITNQPLFIGSRIHQERTARQLARKKVLAMTAATPTRPKRATTSARRRTAKA